MHFDLRTETASFCTSPGRHFGSQTRKEISVFWKFFWNFTRPFHDWEMHLDKSDNRQFEWFLRNRERIKDPIKGFPECLWISKNLPRFANFADLCQFPNAAVRKDQAQNGIWKWLDAHFSRIWILIQQKKMSLILSQDFSLFLKRFLIFRFIYQCKGSATACSTPRRTTVIKSATAVALINMV